MQTMSGGQDIIIGIEDPNYWKVFCSSPNKFAATLRVCIGYAFVDVSPDRIDEVVKEIVAKKPESLAEVAALLYDWHIQLKPEDIIGFGVSGDEYMKTKGRLSTAPIAQTFARQQQHLRLYDIGSGDGGLTKLIGKTLQDAGFDDVKLVRVDINDKINWDSTPASVDTEGNSKQIFYRGDNLDQVIGEDLNANASETSSVVVTYNHALHHWPTPKAQTESIKQLASVIAEGSLVVLKEHFNVMSDDVFSLNHALMHFRYNLFNINGDKIHYNVNNRSDAAKLAAEYVADAGKHNFMSPFWLAETMKRNGFELVAFTPEKEGDPDRTVIYAFRKKSADAPKYIKQSLDDMVGYSTLQELAQKKLLPEVLFDAGGKIVFKTAEAPGVKSNFKV
jgi:SAM-dependent methyltransferase